MPRLFKTFLMCVVLLPGLAAAQLPKEVIEGLRAVEVPLSNVAVVVQEVGASRPSLTMNSRQPLNPASTMKLLTTYAALELLGPAYRWKTEAWLAGDNLILKQYYHIGFAADTPNGLVVPVIRNVDQKGVLQIAKEMGELSAKAREGKLGPADMQGGCFSISSLGGIGGTAFTPIINAPEVAILGVSKSQTKPVWDGKAFAPRLMLPLSFSYDHRVIDGASAARFTANLAGLLADMRRVML